MVLGSGIRKKPIPDPGSRIQGQRGTGSRIPDPDPQHCTQRSLSEPERHVPRYGIPTMRCAVCSAPVEDFKKSLI
jgi:hypothetical protein